MIERLQNESFADYKFRILVEKAKGELDVSWKEVEESLNLGIAHDTLRKGTYFLPEYEEYLKTKLTTTTDNKDTQDKQEELFKYKKTTEILSDGSTKSDKLIEMSEEQSKDTDFLLKVHGFDSTKFEVTNARSSMWNVGNEGKTLYSSKITVKPIKNGIDFEKLVEIMKENIKPSTLKYTINETEENLLEIFLTDMHWGISLWDDYENTLHKIIKRVRSKKWDTILIPIGSDIYHNDGFTGQTTKGTIIDKIDTEQAWKDAFKFYSILIDEAIINSKHVNVIFVDGNHDQAISWAFVKALEIKYPQVKFDSQMKHRKAFVWNEVFLGYSHGDKAKGNRLLHAFLAEYGKELAKATVKEVHVGHLHHEKSRDDFGIVTRTLSTSAKVDDYHYDNGFIGSMKRFQLFEYSKDALDTIYYV